MIYLIADLFVVQNLTNSPRQIILHRILKIFDSRICINLLMLSKSPIIPIQRNSISNYSPIPLIVVIRALLLIKNNCYNFTIPFSRVVRVLQIHILRRFASILPKVSIIGKINKGHKIIYLMRSIDFKKINCSLHPRLTFENICHMNTSH